MCHPSSATCGLSARVQQASKLPAPAPPFRAHGRRRTKAMLLAPTAATELVGTSHW